MKRRVSRGRGAASRPCAAALRVVAIALATTVVSCGPAADDGSIELKLGHVGAPGSLFDLAAVEFARRVEERSGGSVTVATFGSSQLGGDETLLQKIKLGTVDIALPSTVMSSMIDEFGLFEMPYIVDDREHMKRIEEAVVWPDLVPIAEADGYRILAVWENGFRHITNNERPIASPADLEGIKLRTPRGVWRVKLFQALGANPTPMAYSEVFMALQTGVMDGQENPFAQIHSGRLHEVQKYLSLTAHVYTPAFFVVGVNRWDRMPAEVQTVVAETAREMQDYVYETAVRLEEEYLADMQAAGIVVNEADHDAFLAASQSVYDEFAATVDGGDALISKARATADR
ncbi:MAG: TRAP transporter substrate-binding protein [Gemmatimonadota bacterium]|nr:TRAP transporter substrate-binding protein [Gemmatimonadota bacterium]